MFSQKRSNLIVNCDAYIDLYDKCNIGCDMCKFNRDGGSVKQIKINFSNYKNNRVLFCYKTDPYVFDDYELVATTVKKLHSNNCKIVFLTRKANCLIKQLDIFHKDDFIGISISENNSKNSNIENVITLLKEAEKLKLNTWLSLEPVLTSKFANEIIEKVKNHVNFVRVGKDDLIDYNWEKVKKDINVFNNIYIK